MAAVNPANKMAIISIKNTAHILQWIKNDRTVLEGILVRDLIVEISSIVSPRAV